MDSSKRRIVTPEEYEELKHTGIENEYIEMTEDEQYDPVYVSLANFYGPRWKQTVQYDKYTKQKILDDSRLKKFREKRKKSHIVPGIKNEALKTKAGMQHITHENPDPSVLAGVVGHPGIKHPEVPVPQVLVEQIRLIPDMPEWYKYADIYPNLAITRADIRVGESITIAGQQYGVHMLMKQVILYDMLGAANDRIPIFAEAPHNYWKLRASLPPRTKGGWAVGPNITALPDWVSIQSAVPLADLGWYLPSETNGFRDLATSFPVLTEEQLLQYGVEVTAEIWTAMFRNKAGIQGLVPYEEEKYSAYLDSFAAYTNRVGTGTSAMRPWTRFESEVEIHRNHHWISALSLFEPSARRGPHSFYEMAGTGIASWKAATTFTRETKIKFRVKQLSLAQFQLMVSGLYVLADLERQGLKDRSTITQTATSLVSATDGVLFATYVAAVMCKKYSVMNAICRGMELNDDVMVMPAGNVGYVDLRVATQVLPMAVIEMAADLVVNEIDRGDVYEVQVPCLIGTAEWSAPVPLTTASPNTDCIPILEILYPNATINPYNFAVSPYSNFTYANKTTAAFVGSVPTVQFPSMSVLISDTVGYQLVGPAAGNNHGDNPVTKNFYTCLMPPVAVTNGHDVLPERVINKVSNEYAFDPNSIASTLNSILPLCLSNNPVAYVAATGEVVSVEIDEKSAAYLLQVAAQYIHPVAGNESEISIMMLRDIQQSRGGGFMDVLKKIGDVAVPLVSQIGSDALQGVNPAAASALRLGGDLYKHLRQARPPDRQLLRRAVNTASKRGGWPLILFPSKWGLGYSSRGSSRLI
jgi:hypothetical protein